MKFIQNRYRSGKRNYWREQLIYPKRPNKKSPEIEKAQRKQDMLLKTVGEMKIENDFLKKKYRQLYGKEPF